MRSWRSCRRRYAGVHVALLTDAEQVYDPQWAEEMDQCYINSAASIGHTFPPGAAKKYAQLNWEPDKWVTDWCVGCTWQQTMLNMIGQMGYLGWSEIEGFRAAKNADAKTQAEAAKRLYNFGRPSGQFMMWMGQMSEAQSLTWKNAIGWGDGSMTGVCDEFQCEVCLPSTYNGSEAVFMFALDTLMEHSYGES